MPKKSIRIEEAENGFVVHNTDYSAEPIYGEDKDTVFTSTGDLKEAVTKWIDGDKDAFKAKE